ncbi:MAG: nuclear transport factor 2 family protein [Woeseiaceae bacterium]
MTIRRLLFMSLLIPVLTAAQDSDPTIDSIEAVLDDFHDAAAHGDKARYLGHMTKNGVFMGTDEWERWPKNPDFTDYVDGRFKDGGGWSYRSVDRKVQLSEFSNVAWFDEVVFSETNGRFRGTGVLVLEEGEWKIAHYAMSFLVFNEIWEDVIKLTKQTQAEKDKAR